jgi:hypothetical protein
MRSTWGLGYQHISTQEIDTGGVINGDIADAAMFASTLSLIDGLGRGNAALRRRIVEVAIPSVKPLILF